jgi:hypothetical protein
VQKVGNKVVNWELEVENKEVKWTVGNKEGNKGRREIREKSFFLFKFVQYFFGLTTRKSLSKNFHQPSV